MHHLVRFDQFVFFLTKTKLILVLYDQLIGIFGRILVGIRSHVAFNGSLLDSGCTLPVEKSKCA